MGSVSINGSLAEVEFSRFDLEAYGLFLRAKKLPESQLSYDWERDSYKFTTPARFASMLGAEADGRHAGGTGDPHVPVRLSAIHRQDGARGAAVCDLCGLRSR